MKIRIKKLHPNAILPTYAHGPEEDAGMDLYALEDVALPAGDPVLVKTGISIELPPGYEGQIRSRSGLALKHNITVVNSPGTIDPSYRGEIGVILKWSWLSFEVKHIPAGTRIAQLVVSKYEAVEWEETGEDLTKTLRGDGGFGSTS